MQRRRLIPVLVMAIAAACLLPASASAKKKHHSGVRECQQRIADKIRDAHPESRGSSFSSDVQRNGLGNNAVSISGRGQVRTAKNKKKGFSYGCVYNLRSGKLSKLKYKIR
jgi:hypothetical protein